MVASSPGVIIQILNNPITYGYRLYTFTDTFTVKYTENVAHAHAVDTRPSFPLPPIRRSGDEARDMGILASGQWDHDVINGEKAMILCF